MVLELCFDLNKCTKKCSRFSWRSFSLELFSGKFMEIWAKILRTPKKFAYPYTYGESSSFLVEMIS